MKKRGKPKVLRICNPGGIREGKKTKREKLMGELLPAEIWHEATSECKGLRTRGERVRQREGVVYKRRSGGISGDPEQLKKKNARKQTPKPAVGTSRDKKKGRGSKNAKHGISNMKSRESEDMKGIRIRGRKISVGFGRLEK